MRNAVCCARADESRGNTEGARLTITGMRFNAVAKVSLLGADGTEYLPHATTIDSSFQITAAFNLTDVPVGRYGAKVTEKEDVALLRGGFEVFETRKANLETRLVMPGAFGRHAVATIHVEYKNTGNEAMPAPILILQSADADGSDKPLLTLDASKAAP